MEEDDLIKDWEKLSLSSEEVSTVVRVPRFSLDGFLKTSEFELVGRRMCQKPIPPHAILKTFARLSGILKI